MAGLKKLKPKPCRNCKEDFIPFNSLQVCCSPSCAIQWGRFKKERDRKRQEKSLKTAKRKDIAERRERLRTRSDHLSMAQMAFNRYIRARDHGSLCISCRNPPKKINAGHYRSRGSAPELRFDEDNCHIQCEKCNSYLSGNAIEYRINLINKIGIKRVEILEGPHEPLKLTIDEIKALKAKYSKLARQLEKSLCSKIQ